MRIMTRIAKVLLLISVLASGSVAFAAVKRANLTQLQAEIRSAISMDVQSSQLTPSFAELATGSARFSGSKIARSCNPLFHPELTSNPTPCMFGADQGPVWVLWGDSNAGSWIPAVDRAARMHGAQLAVFIFPGCRSRFEDNREPNSEVRLKACQDWHASLPAAMGRLHPSLIMSAELATGFSGKRRDIQKLADSWKSAFETISASTTSVTRVLLEPTPNGLGNGSTRNFPACLSVAENKSVLACSPKISKNLWAAGSYWAYLQAYKESAIRSSAILIPISQLFCSTIPGEVQDCPVNVANYNVFVDQDHVSIAYMEYISSAFNRMLISRGI